MFLILVTVESQGLKTSLTIVQQTIEDRQPKDVEVGTLIVPPHFRLQPASVNEQMIKINKRVDGVIFFERTIEHKQLSAARHRVLIPNPEWLTEGETGATLQLTEMWHKTRYSFTTLAQCFPCVRHAYIGFTSFDLSGMVPNFERFVHFRGKSNQKQSDIVLAAWRKHPEWPELSVQSYVNGPYFLHFPEWLHWNNIRFKYCWMSDDEYRQEAGQAGVHLCPSSVEGFGHYLNEARSIGALIVTTDGAPMNELLDASCAVMVSPVRTEKQNFGIRYIIDVINFEGLQGIEWMILRGHSGGNGCG